MKRMVLAAGVMAAWGIAAVGCQDSDPEFMNPMVAPADAPVGQGRVLAPVAVESHIVVLDEGYFGLRQLEVIKGSAGYADLVWMAQRRQTLKALKAELLTHTGVDAARLTHAYPNLPSMAMRLTDRDAARLRRHPGVAMVVPDHVMSLTATSSLPFVGFEVDENGFNADPSAGGRTTVAVIDTATQYWNAAFGQCGQQGSPSFGGQSCSVVRVTNHTDCDRLALFAPGWECQPGGGAYDTVAANTLHGTNVSGIVRSVAPGAQIWALNVMHLARMKSSPNTTREFIFTSDIIAGLDTISGQPEDVVSVNMSLGAARSEGSTSYCAGALGSAIRTLWEQHGIVVTVSSGNDATKNAIGSPACEPYAVAVGAHYDTQNVGATYRFTNCQDTVAQGAVTCFSNSQRAVDVIAPGGFVRAAGITMSGTSQAAPHAAGFVALLQSEALDPQGQGRLAPHEVVSALRVHGRNHVENARGQDGVAYRYTHRQLQAQGDIAPETMATFHGNPGGRFVGTGQEVTLSVDPGLEQSLVTDVWLDLEIEHPKAQELTVTLRSPQGQEHTLSLEPGGNVNAVFGVQADAALADAFDGAQADGSWKLLVSNAGPTSNARIIRAVLLMDVEENNHQPASVQAFEITRPFISADSQQLQTFQLVMDHAQHVEEVRLMINHPWHSRNGRSYSGYLRLTPEGCLEMGNGYGNADIRLVPERCSHTLAEDGTAVFEVSFAVAPSFGQAQDNTVSAFWVEQGVVSTSWRLMTGPGEGFEVREAVTELPDEVRSFEFGKSSVQADLEDVQTVRLVLEDPNIDEVRVMLNHPWHVENEREPGGYFVINDEGCLEIGGGLGNDHIELAAEGCVRRLIEGGGAVEFMASLRVAPSFGGARSNTVSAIWYEGDVLRSTWRKLNDPGQGFDVVAATVPMGFVEKRSVVANGGQPQTVRLWIPHGQNVDEVLFMVNHPWFSRNGRTSDGYFRWRPQGCIEVGAGFGNGHVRLLEGQCQRRATVDGVEFEVSFMSEPGFEASVDNDVAALWYEKGRLLTSWVSLTGPGEGFDVVAPAGPARFGGFGADVAQLGADGLERQTLRLVLEDGARVDEVRVMLNHPAHRTSGRDFGGYFQWTPQGCQELGGGFGNADVVLMPGACGRLARFDGSVEFVFTFVALPSFGDSSDNQVSVLWYADGSLGTGWRRVTEPGAGFDVLR